MAKLRPTVRVLAAAEERALAAWDEAGCPARALPGIAFGTAEAANGEAASRLAGGER